MIKIIGVIHPFDLNQQFNVYENNNKIASFILKIDNIAEELAKNIEKYNADNLILMGAKQYAKGIGLEVREQMLIKYNKNNLTIDIM